MQSDMAAAGSPFVPSDNFDQLPLAKSRPVLSALNHVSFLCADVDRTKKFYEKVLGFIEVKRPDSFEFEGSWLLGHGGIAVHLISGEPPLPARPINPQDVHVSFVCSDLDAIEAHLAARGVPSVRATVYEAGTRVTQVFCHDPDNNMLEFCNCNCLPVTPLTKLPGAMLQALSIPEGCDADNRPRMSTDSSQHSADLAGMQAISSGSA
eukprot:jgi/Ulvmu1/4621/UM002_0351.1